MPEKTKYMQQLLVVLSAKLYLYKEYLSGAVDHPTLVRSVELLNAAAEEVKKFTVV